MIAGAALVAVGVVSVAVLARQIVRGIQHRDPFRPLENGRRARGR